MKTFDIETVGDIRKMIEGLPDDTPVDGYNGKDDPNPSKFAYLQTAEDLKEQFEDSGCDSIEEYTKNTVWETTGLVATITINID
jgi:hypothetical protein